MIVSRVTLALALAWSAAFPAAAATTKIVAGQPFPAVTLPDATTGEPRSLAEFAGQKVMLHVFASW